MLTRREDLAPHRLAPRGARLANAGLLLSSPLAAAPVLDRHRQERAVRWLLAANGLVAIVAAAISIARLHWVLSPAGLVAHVGWNVLFLVTLVLAASALHRRTRAVVP